MDINESLNRILQARDTVGELFYDHFLSTHPEVQHHFNGVDFKRQRVQLVTALMIIQRYHVDPTPAVEQYLQYLGTKHGEMNIPKEEYVKWTEAMIETMARFHGDEWSSSLEEQWREAIGKAVALMFKGYEEPVEVSKTSSGSGKGNDRDESGL
jgi:hemoglobin-like flavoprotein